MPPPRLLALLGLAQTLAQQAQQWQESRPSQADPRALRGAAKTAHHAARPQVACPFHWVVASDLDLEALRSCRSIHDLTISNTAVNSLADLSSLETAEKVIISGNNFLKSLEGLEKLTRAGGLELRDNRRLASLLGLQGLQNISGDLIIADNDILSSLDGLQGLERAQTVEINHNDALLSLDGLLRLESAEAVKVLNNWVLASLNGLQGLRTLGQLWVDSSGFYVDGSSDFPSQALSSLAMFEHITSLDVLYLRKGVFESLDGFQNLRTVGNLTIDDTRIRSLLPLRSLQSAKRITLHANGFFSSLEGLENLTSVDTLRIDQNGWVLMFVGESGRGLRSLAGLEGLTRVGTLEITSNGELRSIDSLARLTSVDTLVIKDNEELTSLSGLDNLASVGVLCIEENYVVESLAPLKNLRSATEISIADADSRTLTGLEGITSASKVRIWRLSYLESLAGLEGLRSVGELELEGFSTGRLRDLEGLRNLVNVTRRLTITLHNQLLDVGGLRSLRTVGELQIVNNAGLVSLTGLEGLTSAEKLTLTDLPSLQSVAGLQSLTIAWNGVYIERCPNLLSLEGLGALGNAVTLQVSESRLTYLGAPLAAAASVGIINMDDTSWPPCVTPQERAALAIAVDGDLLLSNLPHITTWPRWLTHQRPCVRTNFGTFSCTKGHPCNFSLAGKESNYTSVFISGRFTGCGACVASHLRVHIAEDGLVDFGYALDDEEGGLRSVCRCGEDARGPVAQLLLRGSRQSAGTTCRSGARCTIELEGEALESTDHVVLMSDCKRSDQSSGFEAKWVADNVYILDNASGWGAAPPRRYQVCWRPPCSSSADSLTCPSPEDRYLPASEVELLGAFFRNYTVVLGDMFSAPNIGFGVSGNDRMRLRRSCGEASEARTDLLDANSSGMVFDFGRLTKDRVQPGIHQLCWCQERASIRCNAEWHFTAVTGDVLIECPAGMEVVERSSRCQACPAGRESQAGIAPCTECSIGRFSPGGAHGCRACEERTYADRTGSSTCAACAAWRSSGVEAADCYADPVRLILLASLYLFVGAVCAILSYSLRRRMPVVDVSLDQKCTIVTTFGSHGFSNFGRASFPATFHGTGHPDLDRSSEHFRVRVKDAVRLELLSSKGEHICRRLDTSKGTLAVASPHDLYQQGWRVPVAFSLPALLFVVAILSVLVLSMGMVSQGFLGSAAAALLFTAVSLAVRRRPRITPLELRCSKFKREKELYKSTKACNKGADRAIAIGKLHVMLSFFRDFIRDRTAYYLDSNILHTLTSEDQLSYAELVGAGPVEWFVSHFWGTAFEHFCTALQKHALLVCGDRPWEELRYWICFCSNNQYHIKEELGNGWQESSFYITLQSGLCLGTCMVLDDKALPLTRVWCIFELLQTVKLERKDKRFQGLLFCTSSGVLNSGKGSVEVAMALARKVASMDVSTAQASSQHDADMIRAQVIEDMGSFDALNSFVRHEIRTMLVRAQGSANGQFADVLAILDSNLEETPFVTV